MFNSFENLKEVTYKSHRGNILNKHFFDEKKQCWFKVKKAKLVFVSFVFVAGRRCVCGHYLIEEVERCTLQASDYLDKCSQLEFNRLCA